MKREAVQEERQRSKSEKGVGDEEAENSNLGPGDMPAERILEAERTSDKFELDQGNVGDTDIQTKFKYAGEKQLNSLVEWAKHIPAFSELVLDDQVPIKQINSMLIIKSRWLFYEHMQANIYFLV